MSVDDVFTIYMPVLVQSDVTLSEFVSQGTATEQDPYPFC